MASTLYLRLRDDYLYFTDSENRLMASALGEVLSEFGEGVDPGLIDNGRVVMSVRRAIGKLKGLSVELHKQGHTESSAQEKLKAAFLAKYLPTSFAECNLERLIGSVLERYKVDSINFFPLVLRDVLSSIVSEDLTEEAMEIVTRAVREFLMRALRRCRKDSALAQDLPATVVERKKREQHEAAVREDSSWLLRRYDSWNYGRVLKPISG